MTWQSWRFTAHAPKSPNRPQSRRPERRRRRVCRRQRQGRRLQRRRPAGMRRRRLHLRRKRKPRKSRRRKTPRNSVSRRVGSVGPSDGGPYFFIFCRLSAFTMAGLALRIIVGLGNPGPEHLVTRHNAGFWFVDLLARRHGGEFRDYRKYSGETARITLSGQEITLLKPTTYMNRSGLSVRQLSGFYKIAPEDILVAYDELDLPVGTVRLKQGGGHGGHNGMRDIIAHVGEAIWRLRLGIGHPGNKTEVIDYVLTRAPRAEEDLILEAVSTAADCIPLLLEQGAERAMTRLHSRAGKT